MLQYFIDIDTQLFLLLNGLNCPFFDTFFYYVSETFVWIPLFVLLVVLFFFSCEKNNRWRTFLVIFACAALTVCLTDLVSAKVFKPLFMRFRPCHEPTIEGMVHIVRDHCGGMYGFVSSHAANLFGIANFSHIILKRKYKFTWLLYLWATMIGYSRIYLGVHYPGDVVSGAIVGLLLSWGVAELCQLFIKKYPHHQL